MNTNLIHKWLRDIRFALGDQAADLIEAEEARFLPVEVAGLTSTPAADVSPSPSSGPVTAWGVP